MVPTTHGDAERSCEGARIGAAAVALVRAVPGEAHAHTHSASDHRLRAKSEEGGGERRASPVAHGHTAVNGVHPVRVALVGGPQPLPLY